MRFTRKKSAAALSAAILGLSVAGATAADAGSSKTRACTSFTASEVSHLTIHDAASPGGGAGDSVVYHDELLDASGTQFGFVDGTALVYTNPVNGRLMEALNATAEVPGGTVYATGHIDVIDAGTNQQTLAAVGTTGSLRGKVGTWKFRLVKQPSPVLTIFDASMKLC